MKEGREAEAARKMGEEMEKAKEKSQPTNAPQQIKWKFVCVWKNQVKINWIELSAEMVVRRGGGGWGVWVWYIVGGRLQEKKKNEAQESVEKLQISFPFFWFFYFCQSPGQVLVEGGR